MNLLELQRPRLLPDAQLALGRLQRRLQFPNPYGMALTFSFQQARQSIIARGWRHRPVGILANDLKGTLLVVTQLGAPLDSFAPGGSKPAQAVHVLNVALDHLARTRRFVMGAASAGKGVLF